MARPTRSSWPSQGPPGMPHSSLGLQHCFTYGFETAGWHLQTSQNLPCSLPIRVKTCKTPCCSLLLLPYSDGKAHPMFLAFARPAGHGPHSLGLQHCFFKQPSYMAKPAKLSLQLLAEVTCLRWPGPPSLLGLRTACWAWPPLFFGSSTVLFVRFQTVDGTFKHLKTFPAAFLYVSKPAKLSLLLLAAVTWLRWQGPPSLLGLRKARRAWPPVSLGLQHCFTYGFERTVSKLLDGTLQPSYACQNLQNSPCTSFLLLPAPDGQAHPVFFAFVKKKGSAAPGASPFYYWGMQLQIPRCLIMVGWRLCWFASGAAVFLGNATADSYRCLIMVGWRLRWVASGAAVFLGNATADFCKKVLRSRDL